jgi:hypothetical protein
MEGGLDYLRLLNGVIVIALHSDGGRAIPPFENRVFLSNDYLSYLTKWNQPPIATG